MYTHLGDIERRSGLYILGKPGMGKSALLVNLICQDINNGHGVFFLDPHGDAIDDLMYRGGFDRSKYSVRMRLLDPEDKTYSFGINLLACKDVTSWTERNDAYARARWVFYKLFENELGEKPWLELIIHTTWKVIGYPEDIFQ